MDDSNNQNPSSDIQIIDLCPRPRYVVDFSGPSYNMPIPTQICFFTGDAYNARTERSLALVEIIEIGAPENYNDKWDRIRIKYRALDVEDGHPTGLSFFFSMSTCRRGAFKYGDPPHFISAIDRWANVPDARQAYADVLDVFEHGFGLINAQYLDLKNEMANLNATLARLIPSVSVSTTTVDDLASKLNVDDR
jgi:hypothetical protein